MYKMAFVRLYQLKFIKHFGKYWKDGNIKVQNDNY